MGNEMKELVEFNASSIVSEPEQVEVTVEETNNRVDLRLSVAPDDVGMVIGRRGRLANSLRSLIKVMGTRRGVSTDLSID